MLSKPWDGTHTCIEMEETVNCQFCQNTALWHQLASQVMQQFSPRDPVKIPSRDLPKVEELQASVTGVNKDIGGKSIYLFSTRQILDSSKLKEFADYHFILNKIGRKFSERVENTVGKGEIVVTSNFSFSHSVFKSFVLQTCKNQGLFGKGLTCYHVTKQFQLVMTVRQNVFENSI